MSKINIEYKIGGSIPCLGDKLNIMKLKIVEDVTDITTA